MTGDRAIRAMVGVCTVILLVTALHLARPILAPVAFSLFIIAIVWPLQRSLQARVPQLLALALTLLVTVVALTALASMVVWGFGRVGQWLISNAARFQILYVQSAAWLEQHGLYVASLLAEHFNVAWLIGIVREISGRLQNLLTFMLLALVFTMLGLLEVDLARRKLEGLRDPEVGKAMLRAMGEIAAKLQRYMLIRSLISVMTGIVVWGFVWLAGLELAGAWGVIAFALNYIPFIGPFVATVFPTLFAIAQFESWQIAATVFFGLNLIQFLLGSYLEPRIAGAALALSPFVVLVAVFFWSFLWGLPGALIGVPIMIALHSLGAQWPSGRWLGVVLSGRADGAS
jgi:predicted PurR-regulated permease PerM